MTNDAGISAEIQDEQYTCTQHYREGLKVIKQYGIVKKKIKAKYNC
jgi:hypothetical protein